MQKVLVVDDDEWMAKIFARQLENNNFKVTISLNALEAIDAIDVFHPDVIILDIFMPGPNGIALLHELQSYSDLGQIPVILCTTNAQNISLSQLKPYGVRDLLDKTSMQPNDVVVSTRKVLL